MSEIELTFSLIELGAFALPAMAIVLKTLLDQDAPYPKDAVRGVLMAMVLLLFGILTLLSTLFFPPPELSTLLAMGLIGTSFLALLYGLYHAEWRAMERQEELEGDEEDVT